MERLSIIGLGKLGLPRAVFFASRGFRVIGLDLNPEIVELIKRRNCHIYEPGVSELLRICKDSFVATEDYKFAIGNSEASFIVVPTPSDEDGAFSTEFVTSAGEEIAQNLKGKTDFHLIVLTSTVLPGATTHLKEVLEKGSGKRCGADFGLCYNPQFIALGSVLRGLSNPDLILIGESESKSGEMLSRAYKRVCENNPSIVRKTVENDKELNQEAIEWLCSNHYRKFLLWIHYMNIHVPYITGRKEFQISKKLGGLSGKERGNLKGKVKEGEIGRLIEAYDKQIKYVDCLIEELVGKLKALNILDKTLLIITSDHGEELLEHGSVFHKYVKLYDELTHIPLIIRCPGLTDSKSVNELVSYLDLVPTILDILGIKANKNFQGESLLPLIRGKGQGKREIVSEFAPGPGDPDIDMHHPKTAIRTRKWKLIYDEMDKKYELYALEEDPKETVNVADKYPEVAKELGLKVLEHITKRTKTNHEIQRIRDRAGKLKKGLCLKS